MTKIYGLMVMRNEADRYLHSMLKHSSSFLDEIFILDDQSTDESRDIASEFSCVKVRPSGIPSFLENESLFREFAWRQFEATLTPSIGDWVLSIDADEFVISDSPKEDLAFLTRSTDIGVNIRIPELWTLDPAMIRIDGFWDKNFSPRFFRYQEGGFFSGKKMGCPPFPTYVKSGMISNHLEILHVGYANKEDLQKKYLRYSTIKEGHSSSHIESIILNPQLTPYNKIIPNIYRGSDGYSRSYS